MLLFLSFTFFIFYSNTFYAMEQSPQIPFFTLNDLINRFSTAETTEKDPLNRERVAQEASDYVIEFVPVNFLTSCLYRSLKYYDKSKLDSASSSPKSLQLPSTFGMCKSPEPGLGYSSNSFNYVPRELIEELLKIEEKILSVQGIEKRSKCFDLKSCTNRFNVNNELVNVEAHWGDASGASISIFKNIERNFLIVSFLGCTKFFEKTGLLPVFEEQKTDFKEKDITNASWFGKHNVLAIAEDKHINIYVKGRNEAESLTSWECESEVTSLAWQNTVKSDNSYCIASGYANGIFYLRDLYDKQWSYSDLLHKKAITSISWSPDNKFIATMSEEGEVCIINVDKGSKKYLGTSLKEKINDGCWYFNSLFIMGAKSGKLLVWNIEKNEIVHQYKFTESIYSVSLNSQGVLAVTMPSKILYPKGFDKFLKNEVKITVDPPLSKSSESWKINRELGRCNSVKRGKNYSQNPFKSVPTAVVKKVIEYERNIPSVLSEILKRCGCFNLKNCKNIFNLKNKLVGVRGQWQDSSESLISIFKNIERNFLIVSFLGCTKFFEKTGLLPVFEEKKTNLEEKNIINACWFEKENVLAVAEGNHINIYTERGEEVVTSWECKSKVTSLEWQNAVDDNECYIASGGANGTLDVYDASDEKLFFSSPVHTEAITSISWSADNKRIATMSEDGKVGITDVDTQATVYLKTLHKEKINDGCWDLADSFFIAGTNGGKLLVWNAIQKSLVNQRTLSEPIYSISLNSQGTLAVTMLTHVLYLKSFTKAFENHN